MHAIEIEAEIDRNREIHLKLPADIKARKARVVVLYEDQKEPLAAQRKPIRLGLYRGQIQMSDDFDTPLPDDFWLGGNPRICCWTPTPLFG
jgi:hypothetical protein